jgi:hypothetical protein
VKALIDVQNDTFTIQSFDALGSDEVAISIRGQVIAKEETHVDITLSARDAPLDQALHDAVPKPVATVMDRLLDQNALDRLVHKGLLRPDEFKLGGTVDMTLVIQHSGKNGESVQVSGDLNFKDTTIIHEGFPFPILVEDGSVQLEPERIFVPVKDRLKFVGYTGGEGSLAGAINFDQDGNTNPNIAAVLKNVPISELMVEAVSVSSGSSYQTTSQVLGGLGLEGQFDASGSVMTSEHGEIIQNIEVTIDESTATPKPSFAKAIQSSNAFWPEGFELFDVTSNVLIDNQGVHIKEVQARFEENGRLHAAMDIQGGAYDLEIQGENWPISPKLVNLLPPTACMKLSPAWEIFEPSGTFNTEIHLTHTNGTSSFHLQAEPTTLGITGGGSTMVMQRESGGIIVSDSNVYLNDLQFSIAQNDSIQGAVAFDGTIFAREERTDYDIQGEWTNAEASSPLSRAITGIIGGDTGLEYYDSLSPNGTGLVSLETVRNDDLDFYRVIVSPETLSATFNERVANATFLTTDSSFKNEIVFDNTGITFDRLGGTLGEGVFSLLGKINTEQNVSGSVVLDWDGRADDKNLFAVLPSVVGDTLEAMEIGEGTSRVVGGEVSFIGGSWSDLEIDFEGEIDLNGVSMNAGIPLSDIDGVTKVEGIYDEEKLTSLQVLLDIDEMTAVGREITDIHGGLLLDPQQGKMVFNDLRGESSSGVVTITGFVDVGETKKYQVTVLLSGVQLDDRSDSEASTFSGDLTGWLAIEGVRGAVHDRVGVGRLQVSQGMFAEVPIAMRFMQLLQLSLPTSESITNVVIDLSIDGDEVQLNNIKLTGDDTSAQGLVIQGEGKLEMPSFEIDVELHPRMGWPVLRDIAGVLGDQFFSIRAKGQLLEPEIAIVPLPTLLNED